jgi:predicted Fe-Mo cluster-binding NifX family protein
VRTAFACWDDRIAPVLDTAQQICVVETEAGRIVTESRETLPEDLPVQKALRLVELEIDTLVCGAISTPVSEVIAAYGIHLLPFVAGDLREVIGAWLAGNLMRPAFAMPGCCGRGRRQRIFVINKEEFNMSPQGGGGTRRGGGQGRGGSRQGGGGGKGQGGGRQGQGGGGQGQGGGGQRRGRMGGTSSAGPSGVCVCPQCGHSEPHERGTPCTQKQCPKCGTPLNRQ